MIDPARFDQSLNKAGFRTEKGQIAGASIVKVRFSAAAGKKMSTSRLVRSLRAGARPKGGEETLDARWGKSYFGYKNHNWRLPLPGYTGDRALALVA